MRKEQFGIWHYTGNIFLINNIYTNLDLANRVVKMLDSEQSKIDVISYITRKGVKKIMIKGVINGYAAYKAMALTKRANADKIIKSAECLESQAIIQSRLPLF